MELMYFRYNMCLQIENIWPIQFVHRTSLSTVKQACPQVIRGNAATFSSDGDNPDIKEGSTFADKDAFRLVIKQYAIKRGFQTFVEHSDKSRYRARCADSECEWKVHAKKLRGCPTQMVFMSVAEPPIPHGGAAAPASRRNPPAVPPRRAPPAAPCRPAPPKFFSQLHL